MFTITPIVISCLISTVVLTINTFIAWQRRQERSGYYFSLFTASLAFWGVMVTLGYAAVPLQLKVFFAVLDAWGYRTAEVFLFLFALCFAGYEHIAEKKWIKAYACVSSPLPCFIGIHKPMAWVDMERFHPTGK